MLRKLVIAAVAAALAVPFGGILFSDDASAGIMLSDRSGVVLGS